MPLGGRTNKYEIVSAVVRVRKGDGTNKLWHTIPYHFQPNSPRSISVVLYVDPKKKEKQQETEKRKTRRGVEIQNRKKERKYTARSSQKRRAQKPYIYMHPRTFTSTPYFALLTTAGFSVIEDGLRAQAEKKETHQIFGENVTGRRLDHPRAPLLTGRQASVPAPLRNNAYFSVTTAIVTA